MAKLTAQERRAYEAFAQRELVKPFLDAMREWKGKVKADPLASSSTTARKPIPCHPAAICFGPLPGGPRRNKAFPLGKRLKVRAGFLIGP